MSIARTFALDPDILVRDEAITLGTRIIVFARPGRVARTLAIPAQLDDAQRAAIRAEVLAALEDARSGSAVATA